MEQTLQILIIILFVIFFRTNEAGRVTTNPIDTMYGSSLYREGHRLDVDDELIRYDNIGRLHECLHSCLLNRPYCRSFNYSPTNGTCILLSDTLCGNETLLLTPDLEFSYYDVMNSPDEERKQLTDPYCQSYGKCSPSCYPRKPLFVEEKLTRSEAFDYCRRLSRKLPQPKSQSDNLFYGEFSRKAFDQNVVLNVTKEMEIVNKANKSDSSPPLQRYRSINDRAPQMIRSFIKNGKFWIGVTDKEHEGVWSFDDGSQVSEHFSAWAVAQPDNGGNGIGAKPENCAAIDSNDNSWIDMDCEQKLHFFCA
ncbi:Proprotein convertase subtilisin/kexin type 9 [Blomia tropicalis]|nr:Proprotein convertase subtilisin/kexin type 9 [Blomia tropicalis]